jgi:hypothetical protein
MGPRRQVIMKLAILSLACVADLDGAASDSYLGYTDPKADCDRAASRCWRWYPPQPHSQGLEARSFS